MGCLITTLSGLTQMDVALSQGSALARATLGWELVNAFGVSVRIITNFRSRQVNNYPILPPDLKTGGLQTCDILASVHAG